MKQVSPLFLGILGVFLSSGYALSQQPMPSEFGAWRVSGIAQISMIVFIVSGWIVSICLHEGAHALAAFRFGDKAIEKKGYLTLDPRRYVHPIYSVLLPMLIVLMGGFALPGAAVYVLPSAFAFKWQRSMVSLAGPLANLGVFLLCCLPFLWAMPPSGSAPHMSIWPALAAFCYLQLTAILFNLLPVPGFDGYGVLSPFLPKPIVTAISKHQSRIMLGMLGLFIFLPGTIAPLLTFASQVTSYLGIPTTMLDTGLMALRP